MPLNVLPVPKPLFLDLYSEVELQAVITCVLIVGTRPNDTPPTQIMPSMPATLRCDLGELDKIDITPQELCYDLLKDFAALGVRPDAILQSLGKTGSLWAPVVAAAFLVDEVYRLYPPLVSPMAISYSKKALLEGFCYADWFEVSRTAASLLGILPPGSLAPTQQGVPNVSS